jgi:hypothetical protein
MFGSSGHVKRLKGGVANYIYCSKSPDFADNKHLKAIVSTEQVQGKKTGDFESASHLHSCQMSGSDTCIADFDLYEQLPGPIIVYMLAARRQYHLMAIKRAGDTDTFKSKTSCRI